MKIVKVVYTTKPDYAAKNMDNIKSVMSDLRRKAHPGMFYHVCVGPDGKTFTHTAFFDSDEDREILNELASFKQFQEQLKASIPEIPPQQEFLTLVGSSAEMFR